MRSPLTRATLHMARFSLVLAVVLFGSAGTLRFWQAWLYIGLQIVTMTATNAYLARRDPALLERRLAIAKGEKERAQRIVMALVRGLGVAMLVLAGLDRRFGWSAVPPAVVTAAAVVFVLGVLVVVLVYRENTFTSAVIEVDEGQRVVSTGPYRLVRHPMYAGTLLMGVATPLLLGSYWAELQLPVSFAVLVVRLVAEERFLAERLAGYR
jgi:protein-S-isoprenylcysteine O-methyltransferase Ste14